MELVEQVARRAARRLGWDRANRTLGRVLIGLFAFACLAVLAEKLLFIGTPIVCVVVAAAGAAAGLVAWFAVRNWPTAEQAAVEIDGRLRLAERISSALAVSQENTPMARAVVADGRAYARAVPMTDAFPLRLHREFWFVFGLAALAIALLGLMPQYDLLARREKQALARKETEAVRREAVRMQRRVARLRKRISKPISPRVEKHLERIEKVIGRMEKGKLTRAEALAKLSELGKSLKQARKGIEDKKIEFSPAAYKDKLSLTRGLAEALAKKEFGDAAGELAALVRKAAAGKLSRQEMEKLNRELQKLAQSLRGAKDLSAALQECAASLSEADMAKLNAALAKAEFELDQLARMQEELAALRACAGLCKGAGDGLCNRIVVSDKTGIYNTGDGRGAGPGMGGPGIGAGGIAPIQPEDVAFSPGKLRGQMRPGRVVGSFFADGRNLKGEAKAAYASEVEAAGAEAAQALQTEQIPHAYESYVRDYFHSMKTE